jgi:imidazolonepropionase
MIAEGVSTIEIKSGYGLDIDNELKMLRAARGVAAKAAGAGQDQLSRRTCRAARNTRAAPTPISTTSASRVLKPRMPKDWSMRSTVSARASPFQPGTDCPRVRQGQGARHSGQAACRAAVQSRWRKSWQPNTARCPPIISNMPRQTMRQPWRKPARVAVILPGAFYTLRETVAPPIQAFREAGVPMAVATDCNPGSSPMSSLLLSMNMACTLFRMTPEEALAGVTRNAARALGLDDAGQIKPGLRADLAIWNVEHPAELAYRIGFNPLWKRIFGGAL